jgi:hypothetical protein
LGAVSIDLYKKEKEYRHLTLSDKNVVKYLIEFRSQVDVSYGATSSANIHVAGDMMDFNVELIALYTSLDDILSRMKMKDRDREVIALLFQGNTVADIVEYHGFPRRSCYNILERTIDGVINTNKEDWEKSMRSQGLVTQKNT